MSDTATKLSEADLVRAMLSVGKNQIGNPPYLPKSVCDTLRAMGINEGFTEVKKIPVVGSCPEYVRRG